jgi:hypothetical protein
VVVAMPSPPSMARPADHRGKPVPEGDRVPMPGLKVPITPLGIGVGLCVCPVGVGEGVWPVGVGVPVMLVLAPQGW